MSNTNPIAYEWNTEWAEMIQSDISRSGWTHSGMAIRNNGEIITSDNGESKIIRYSPEGKILDLWEANFTHAHGITLSPDDEHGEIIWIADNGSRKEQKNGYEYPAGSENKSGRVFKTTLSGHEIFELPFPPHPSYEKDRFSPTAIAINEKGLGGNGDVWIADGYGASLIHQYDQKGNYIKTLDGSTGAGRFTCPHGIIIDRRNPVPELYIADRVNKRVQVFDLDGIFLRSFGEDFLSTPSGFAIHGDTLIIAELKGRLTFTNLKDEFLGYLFPNEGVENRPGWPNAMNEEGEITKNVDFPKHKFNSPHEVVTDTKGNIYITEWLIGGRITKLTPN